ncbi:interferon gamma receptor 1-like isoform X2 [Mustelus asterias]
MWRSRTPVSSLLLFCAFFLYCSDRSPLHALGHSELHPPENLSIVSHDFCTVLKWDVPPTSRSSLFNVQILDYRSGKWKPFSPCSNISMHQCDLSEVFIPVIYENGYCAKVNAVAGWQKSYFSHSYRFTFGNNATLGPPTVHLTADKDELAVELNYTVPSPKNEIHKILTYLSYNIYLRNPETSEIQEVCENQDPILTMKVPVGVICVSAEVHIDILKLKGNRSQETCLLIQLNDSSVLALTISGGILAVLFVGLLATVLICYFVKKKRALPKVLAHHIVGRKRYSNINSMKPEESNLSVLTTLETVPNVCEVDQKDETQVKMIKDSSDLVDADPVTVDVDDSEPVNSDLKDPYAAKIDVSGTDQKSISEDNFEEGNSDLEKTDDLCKTNSDFEKQICANNWGYDKPQVLLILNN